MIAAEDDEFCVRVRRLGGKILLLDAPMARHDVAMHALQRSGGAERGARATPTRRWRLCTAKARNGILCAIAAGSGSGGWRCRSSALALAPFTRGLVAGGDAGCLCAAVWAHCFAAAESADGGRGDAWIYAFFTVMAKFPVAARDCLSTIGGSGRGQTHDDYRTQEGADEANDARLPSSKTSAVRKRLRRAASAAWLCWARATLPTGMRRPCDRWPAWNLSRCAIRLSRGRRRWRGKFGIAASLWLA